MYLLRAITSHVLIIEYLLKKPLKIKTNFIITAEMYKQRDYVSNFLRVNSDKRYSRLKECGKLLTTSTCTSCKKKYHTYSYFCGIWFCPICQERRQFRLFQRFESLLNSFINPVHLILTFRNWKTCNNEDLHKLQKAFSNFRRTKIFKQMTNQGFYSIELKFNCNRNDWHVHIHCLIDSLEFTSFWQLVETWSKSYNKKFGLPDELLNIHINKIELGKLNLITELRYITKSVELFHDIDKLKNSEKNKRLNEVFSIKNIRFFSAFGDFYGYQEINPFDYINCLSFENIYDFINSVGYENIRIMDYHFAVKNFCSLCDKKFKYPVPPDFIDFIKLMGYIVKYQGTCYDINYYNLEKIKECDYDSFISVLTYSELTRLHFGLIKTI